MANRKEDQSSGKKPAVKRGGLFTALCVTLVVVGVGVIAYPFALIALEERNKDQVVAQLEKELTIFRADEDFEMLDESDIAAMPVVAVPQWTTDEVAAANALLDGNNSELIADRPLDASAYEPVQVQQFVMPTEAPQPGVNVIYDDEMTAVQLDQSQVASLPDPPLGAYDSNASVIDAMQALGTGSANAQSGSQQAFIPQGESNQSFLQPNTQTGQASGQSGAQSKGHPPTTESGSAPVAQGDTVAQQSLQLASAPVTQGNTSIQQPAQSGSVPVAQGDQTLQQSAQSGSVPAVQGAQTLQQSAQSGSAPAAQDSTSLQQSAQSGSVPAAQGDQTLQQSAQSGSVPTVQGDQTLQQSAQSGSVPAAQGDQTLQQSAQSGSVPAAQGDLTASVAMSQQAPSQLANQNTIGSPINEIGLPSVVSPVVEEQSSTEVGVVPEVEDAALPTDDPRLTIQLRDAAPVYYEDFARILDEANALAAKLAVFTPRTDETRKYDSPTELTVASIKSQVNSITSLMHIFEKLPSVAGAYAAFSGADGTHSITLTEGCVFLATDLAALDQVVAQLQRLQRFPRARDLMQNGFDQSVQLADQALNLLDYMAQQLSAKDVDSYLRSRSASLVGETEAAYLLELPSLDLKVGCFPNVTFEQMYKTMRKGAALYPRVGTPNTNTNISMICHRTGSAAFFKDINQLRPGDTVLMHTRGLGSFRYIVERLFEVDEDDWTPMHALGYPSLTLISCEEYNGISHGKRIMASCKLIGIAR